MNARETEARLLARCDEAAHARLPVAADDCEANLFHMAGLLTRSDYPACSRHLLQASEAYFAHHPDARCSAAEVIHKGWIISLPRLRDGLRAHLAGSHDHA